MATVRDQCDACSFDAGDTILSVVNSINRSTL